MNQKRSCSVYSAHDFHELTKSVPHRAYFYFCHQFCAMKFIQLIFSCNLRHIAYVFLIYNFLLILGLKHWKSISDATNPSLFYQQIQLWSLPANARRSLWLKSPGVNCQIPFLWFSKMMQWRYAEVDLYVGILQL